MILAVVAILVLPAVAAAGVWAVRQGASPTPPAPTPLALTDPSASLSSSAQASPSVVPPQPVAAGSIAPSPAPTSAPAPTLGVTAHSPVSPTTGTQVFFDDFTDPNSGWKVGSGTGGVTYGYGAGGYTIVAPSPYDYYAPVPYADALSEVSLSVTAATAVTAAATATATGDSAGTGGFGVSCLRSVGGDSQLEYDFGITETARWYVERYDGTFETNADPVLLHTGSVAAKPSVKPVTLLAVCAALDGGSQVRLMLFVDGVKVTDFVNSASADPSGWHGAVVAVGGDSTSTNLTVSRVSESDLGGPPAINGEQT